MTILRIVGADMIRYQLQEVIIMKRCSNPNCETSFLFGDDKVICPFCHSKLVKNMNTNDVQTQPILPSDRVTMEDDMDNRKETFICDHLRTLECHGRIVEIDRQELFNSKWHKLFNSLLRGEPYQFAHQTIEYTVRVENITEGLSMETTDFCLFGSYLGRLQVGDEVVVRAKNFGDHRAVKSIYNETTSSTVKTGFQIQAVVIRGAFLIAAVAIIGIICDFVWLVKSGTIEIGLSAIAATLIPIIIFCIGFWLLIRSIIPRRRRRR